MHRKRELQKPPSWKRQNSSKTQLHEHGARNRVVVVGIYFVKTEQSIHDNRLIHLAGKRIQTHPLVTNLSRRVHNRCSQFPAQALSTKIWAHVQPFHLAVSFPNASQRHATGSLIIFDSQKQTASRRSVFTRQLS